MSKTVDFIFLVPARKGSKRIKNKNLMKLNNKYLISHSVEHAKKSREIILQNYSYDVEMNKVEGKYKELY